MKRPEITILKPYQANAIQNAEKLGELDFNNPQTAKAEIYTIFNILFPKNQTAKFD